MVTKEQVDKAWKEWNDYKEKRFIELYYVT